MAVKLRLKRMGSKAKPFYRIVAADSRSPRDGRFLEVVGTYDPIKGSDRDGKFLESVGTYDPIKKDCPVTVNEERALYWMQNGAIPTDTVRSILSKQGIMKKFAESKKAGK